MSEKLLFIELFRDGLTVDDFPKSKEPDIELLRAFTLLKENGYDIEFLDVKLGNVTWDKLHRSLGTADYLFINCKTYNRYFCLDLIAEAKKVSLRRDQNVKIVLYGQHPEAEPHFFLDKHADVYIIQQELIPFFRSFSSEERFERNPNLIYKEADELVRNEIIEVKDMDALPLLDLSYLDDNYYTLYPMKTLKKHSWGFLTVSKGCPFSCVFCSRTLRVSCGHIPRFFSATETLRRIRRLIDDGHNFIRFLDDDWHDKIFIRKICKAIIEEGLEFRWMAQVRADSLDMPTLRLMKKAGCECLNIGVESGSEKILKVLKKEETLEDIRKAFSLCRKLDIYTVAYFMIGNPGETDEDLEMSFDLLKDLRPTMLQIAYFTPYPGSSFYGELPDGAKSKTGFFHYANIVYNFSSINTKKLKKTMRRWNLWFYSRPRNFHRLLTFRLLCLINNPRRELSVWREIFMSFWPFRK
ncbi:MAG: B12-binding domain-containing radical SAM protein [Candidatus Woesearchaeota archaeon]